MKIKIIIFLTLWLSLIAPASSQASAFDVTNLIPGRVYSSLPHNGLERISIYCYKGVPKHILHFWQSVRLQLNIGATDWESYVGHTSGDVLEEYDARRSFWTLNLPFSRKSDALVFNPFNSSCIGISTASDHSVLLYIIRIDFWRVLLFIGGFFLFLAAHRLSSNPIFYYSCGVTLGVSTSFLILVYFLSKLIPKRPAVYGFLAGGWAITAYLLQLLFANLKTIAQLHQNYVFAYFAIAGILSFAVCYRYGPVSNLRTMALIRWALQGTGLAAMFYSSQFTEASLAFVLLLVMYHNFPKSWLWVVIRIWRSRFPPRPKLLTEDEYHELGTRETAKALEGLRQYCSSPKCNQWKTMLMLKDPVRYRPATPKIKRFAEFMEGKSHLSDAEIADYDTDLSKPALTDDDDSDFG